MRYLYNEEGVSVLLITFVLEHYHTFPSAWCCPRFAFNRSAKCFIIKLEIPNSEIALEVFPPVFTRQLGTSKQNTIKISGQFPSRNNTHIFCIFFFLWYRHLGVYFTRYVSLNYRLVKVHCRYKAQNSRYLMILDTQMIFTV